MWHSDGFCDVEHHESSIGNQYTVDSANCFEQGDLNCASRTFSITGARATINNSVNQFLIVEINDTEPRRFDQVYPWFENSISSNNNTCWADELFFQRRKLHKVLGYPVVVIIVILWTFWIDFIYLLLQFILHTNHLYYLVSLNDAFHQNIIVNRKFSVSLHFS